VLEREALHGLDLIGLLELLVRGVVRVEEVLHRHAALELATQRAAGDDAGVAGEVSDLDLGALDEARRLLAGATTKQRPLSGNAVVNDILSLVY
jgi:hypothetical protein